MNAAAEAPPRRAVRARSALVAFTFFLAVLTRSMPFLALHLLADVALAGYVYLLIQYQAPGAGAAVEGSATSARRTAPAPYLPTAGPLRHRVNRTARACALATDGVALTPRRVTLEPQVRSLQPARRRTPSSSSSTARVRSRSPRRGGRSVRARTAIRAVHRRRVPRSPRADRGGGCVPGRGRGRARPPRRRALRRVPQRRQEGIRRGQPHARVRRGQSRSRPPRSSASTCSRTSTGWRKRRASCAARCSTASGANEGAEAERLLALMDDGLRDARDRRLPRRAHRRPAAFAPTRCAAVLERTRGDVTTAIVAARLQAAIEGRSSQGPTGF